MWPFRGIRISGENEGTYIVIRSLITYTYIHVNILDSEQGNWQSVNVLFVRREDVRIIYNSKEFNNKMFGP